MNTFSRILGKPLVSSGLDLTTSLRGLTLCTMSTLAVDVWVVESFAELLAKRKKPIVDYTS